MAGKRFLICSGAEDKLVPYSCSEPFLGFFKQAATAWPELDLAIEDNVYPGRGHEFSPEMVDDAVRFVRDVVASGSDGTDERERSSKM